MYLAGANSPSMKIVAPENVGRQTALFAKPAICEPLWKLFLPRALLDSQIVWL